MYQLGSLFYDSLHESISRRIILVEATVFDYYIKVLFEVRGRLRISNCLNTHQHGCVANAKRIGITVSLSADERIHAAIVVQTPLRTIKQ